MRATAAIGLLLAGLGGTVIGGCRVVEPVPFAPAGDTDGGPDDTTTPLGGPTYYGQVDDILAAHCWECHSDAGGHGVTFPLDLYATPRADGMPPIDGAYGARELILARTRARTMPPYFASGAACAELDDHGRLLSDYEIEILRRWVERGAQEGDPSTPPPTRPVQTHIPISADETAHVVTLGPYAPALTLDEDDTRCFVVSGFTPSLPMNELVTAIEVTPGSPDAVHHVVVYGTNDLAPAMAMLDAAHPERGYACGAGAGVPGAEPIASWTPGRGRIAFPQNGGRPTGIATTASSATTDFIVRIRYHRDYAMQLREPPDGGRPLFVDGGMRDAARTADTGVDAAAWIRGPAVYPEDRTVLTLGTMPQMMVDVGHVETVENTALSLPGGDSMASASASATMSSGRVLRIFPQMQSRGRTAHLARGGATPACVLDLPRWNPEWEQWYDLAAPVDLASDTLTLDCTYDTRGVLETTTAGEAAGQELCRAYVFVVP